MKHPLNLVSELIGDKPNCEKLFEILDSLDNDSGLYNILNITTDTGHVCIETEAHDYKTFDVDGEGRAATLQKAILEWFGKAKPIVGMECYTVDGREGTIIDMGTADDYEHLKPFDKRMESMTNIIKHCQQGYMKNCFLVAIRINGRTSVWWFTSGGVQLTENNPKLPV